MPSITASTISSTLSRNGLRTAAASDRMREGVRCTGRDPVRVTADIDTPSIARERATEAAAILEREGYRLEFHGLTSFTVTGRRS